MKTSQEEQGDALTLKEIGEPILMTATGYCDEIEDIEEEVREIAKMLRDGAVIGKWRIKHLDRAAQVLHRALIFRLEPNGYSYKVGDPL